MNGSSVLNVVQRWIRGQQVNKRQKNKRIKRKWQMLLSDLMLRATWIRIKPSRVKAKMIIGEDIIVKGIGAGLEFDIRITSKE